MRNLWNDLRYAMRTLGKSPGQAGIDDRISTGKIEERAVAGYGGCGTEGGFEPEHGTRRDSRRGTRYNSNMLREGSKFKQSDCSSISDKLAPM